MDNRITKGFTLIEMLTVLVIIGLIMSMLFPALQKARQRARILRAKSEVRELTKALDSYYYTYKNWGSLHSGSVDANMVSILAGDNPDKIQFMTFPSSAEAEGFKDPWGIVYQVTLETPDSKKSIWAYSTRVYLENRNRM